MNPDYFLVSSYDPVERHHLHGFCFQGEDLIVDDAGYQRYVAARHLHIGPGQDGSYIVVHPSDQEIVIGTDFSGYHKLFLYQRGERWALSNSLIQLVRFAAEKNLPVTIDENHLASFFIEGLFGDQLASFRTSVREVRLVPSTMEAVIVRTFFGTTVKLRPTAAASAQAEHKGTYGEALREYLRLWTGRMATMLKSDLFMRSDLTGGRDSRAVLSLMLAAARSVGEGLIRNVNFTSNKDAEADFAVASRIAEEYGLRFMDTNRDPRAPVRLETAEAYEKWKSLCLGVYSPIYFPGNRPVPTAVVFGGAGGEGHRRFYPSIAPDQFIDQRRRFIPSRAHFKRLKRDILEDLSMLRQGPGASVDPMVLHYRHFRDRCHGGRAPQYTTLISPLSGALLRHASSMCSAERMERSQVLADILVNVDHKLAAMPYDSPKKSFDARHFAEVTDASAAFGSARTDGRIFAADATPMEDGDFTREKALRLLRDDFLTHYERMRGTGFFPKAYLERARSTAEDAALHGRLVHARSGSAVSHVILAGELSRLSN